MDLALGAFRTKLQLVARSMVICIVTMIQGRTNHSRYLAASAHFSAYSVQTWLRMVGSRYSLNAQCSIKGQLGPLEPIILRLGVNTDPMIPVRSTEYALFDWLYGPLPHRAEAGRSLFPSRLCIPVPQSIQCCIF